MYEEFTQNRILKLRMQKGVSARDMSLSLGQNSNYINQIENKKALPSQKQEVSRASALRTGKTLNI